MFKILVVILSIFSQCYAVSDISLKEQIKQTLKESKTLSEQIIKAIQNTRLQTLDRSKVHEQDIQKMGQIILNPVNRKHPIILTFDTNRYFELGLAP